MCEALCAARSESGDIIEPSNGDNLVATQENTRPVPADSQPDGIMDVNLARARAVPKIVEIGISEFEIMKIAANEGSQTDIR